MSANDFQRDLLLRSLAARLRQCAPGVVLRIIPSGVPTLDMLRNKYGNWSLVRVRRTVVPAFIHGSKLVAMASGMLQATLLRGLKSVPVPLPSPDRCT